MTAQQLLATSFPQLLRIQPSAKNLELYQEIQTSFMQVEFLDSFSQIKKSSKAEGLEFEIMFYNKDFIFDIVVTRTTIDFITVLVKNINMIFLETAYGESTNQLGLITNSDSIKLTISYGGDLRTLIYQTDIKRFSEINKLRTSILNLIKP